MTFDEPGVIRTDDESELSRILASQGDAGVGEVLAEMDEDLVDLGFRTE